MTDSRDSSDATRNHTVEQHTETSPLKKNERKTNWLSSFWNPLTESEQGSLRTIILNFFGFTVIVTIALFASLYYGVSQVKPHGSISTDSQECSQIGLEILKKGGNAVDAAVAATLCLGVVNFHITGLGGGGYMIVYNHRKLEVLDVIDFQATVPNSLSHNTKVDSTVEGLTVGVPGQLLGLWEAHERFGKLPWEDVVMPSYNLAITGFTISRSVVSSFSHVNLKSNYNKNLVQFLETLQEGKNVSFPELAATLRIISATGPHEFYNGSLAMDIIYSVKAAEGSMTMNDLAQYQTSHSELLHTKFGNFNVLASGSSSGGALLLNALDNIQFLDLSPDDDVANVILKMSDILRDSYVSYLDKVHAVPYELETVGSHVSVTDTDDLYVAVVSGLNTWLGSQLLTEAGFILNNAVVSGGVNSEGRPFSFSTPVIAIENDEICGKRIIMGSDDAMIAAQVLTHALFLNRNITESVESPRFFVDSKPRHIRVEDRHDPFFDPGTVQKLQSLMMVEGLPPPYKTVCAIQKIDDDIVAHADSRGGGSAFQFK